MRKKVEELAHASWDWVFHWGYQSSDEDDVEPVAVKAFVADLEGNQRPEGEPVTRKVYRSRPPAWRTDPVSDLYARNNHEAHVLCAGQPASGSA